ncbi:hypothetical protein F5Y06DRAFT_302690 [Hypoxylon sp. FL0890]|nr:hypothetical protein F5Y06DRAFT_302690 [Hypoxylon sp. FL0890]
MPSCPAEPKCFEVRFEADPDIAGIGVILAFLISAWSSLLVITVEFFSLHRDGFDIHFAFLDELLKGYIQKLTKRFKKPWALESIQPAVLMVSDQQLVTGISIMNASYIQHCTITQYHFYIVYLLGFISCQVYNASLGALKLYVNERPAMKLWRAILMTVLTGMVIHNSFITCNDEFLTGDEENLYFGSSTQCVWSEFVDTKHYQYELPLLIATLIILLWSYLEDAWVFYPEAFRWLGWVSGIPVSGLSSLHGWIDKRIGEYQHRYTESRQIDTKTRPGVLRIVVLCRWALWQLLLIVLQALFWVIFVPTLTCMEILSSREALGKKRYRNENALETGSETDGLFLPASNQNFLYDEPAALCPSPPSRTEGHDTTYLANKTPRQQRQDTEARAGFPDNPVAEPAPRTAVRARTNSISAAQHNTIVKAHQEPWLCSGGSNNPNTPVSLES